MAYSLVDDARQQLNDLGRSKLVHPKLIELLAQPLGCVALVQEIVTRLAR